MWHHEESHGGKERLCRTPSERQWRPQRADESILQVLQLLMERQSRWSQDTSSCQELPSILLHIGGLEKCISMWLHILNPLGWSWEFLAFYWAKYSEYFQFKNVYHQMGRWVLSECETLSGIFRMDWIVSLFYERLLEWDVFNYFFHFLRVYIVSFRSCLTMFFNIFSAFFFKESRLIFT